MIDDFKKFVSIEDLDDWEVMTDSGWHDCSAIGETVPYQIYKLELNNGMSLKCADTHIVFKYPTFVQVYVTDLQIGDKIITEDGFSEVKILEKTNDFEHMFDIQVDHDDHRYYTNGILSHNTTIAAGYILWYAMFVPDSTILIAAHKYAGALEIMGRIRFAYENVPDYIRAGVRTYNKGSIDFDNGSRIVSATTTENTGRGMSITLLYCVSGKTVVTVRDKITKKIKTIPIEELYRDLKYI